MTAERESLFSFALRLRRNWWCFALGLHERVPGWHKRRLQGWLANRYIRSYFQWEKATAE